MNDKGKSDIGDIVAIVAIVLIVLYFVTEAGQ